MRLPRLAAALAAAAALAPAARAQVSEEMVAPRPRVYWTKSYSLSPFQEHWTSEVAVKNWERDLPRVLEAFNKEGAAPTAPLENMASSRKDRVQQLSYRLSRKSGARMLKRLKRVARRASEPAVSADAARAELEEIRRKIELLMAAKRDHGPRLDGIAGVGDLVDEALEQLLLAEKARQDSRAELLWNLTVRQQD